MTSTPPSGVRAPSIARPCAWCCGRGSRPGERSSGTSCRRTRSRGRTSRGLERPDRQSQDGSTDRKRPVPRRAARARQADRPPPQPPLLGTAPSLRRAVVLRFASLATDPSDGLRSGELDVAWSVHQLLSRPFVGCRGCAWSRPSAPSSSSSPSARGERASGASQQARSPRARVRGRPHCARPADTRRDRPLRSRARQRPAPGPSRYYEPNWSAYRYRPAQARRLLEQAGCRRGADGVFSCEGQRLSLRFVTTAGRPPRAQALALIQAQLRAAGVEVVPVFAAPGASSARSSRGEHSTSRSSRGSAIRVDRGSDLRLRRRAELHRVLPATRHRPSQPGRQDRSTSVRKPESSTEPTGGSRVTSRRSRSTSRRRAAYDTTVRNFVFIPWN